jgi:hypothetical protein
MPTESRQKPCCMISEFLEEAGLDRGKVRALRRQVLEGIIMLCRWQLERMEKPQPPAGRGKAKKVAVT